MVEFTEYPAVIVRNLNHCVKEPHSHLAVFVMTKDGGGRLDFVQNMEYKFVELLSLNLQASPRKPCGNRSRTGTTPSRGSSPRCRRA